LPTRAGGSAAENLLRQRVGNGEVPLPTLLSFETPHVVRLLSVMPIGVLLAHLRDPPDLA